MKAYAAVFLFASRPDVSKLGVFLAAAAALVASSLLAVLAGERLAVWLRPELLTTIAGGVFIAIGVWMLLAR